MDSHSPIVSIHHKSLIILGLTLSIFPLRSIAICFLNFFSITINFCNCCLFLFRYFVNQLQVEEPKGCSKKKGDKIQNLMGTKGSSSKSKSSKKKSSKVSRKKKIRRNESKKRSHRHDSRSSYSDEDSISSPSISTSTSESDHKSRKNKYKKIRRDYSVSSDDNSMSSDSDSLSNDYGSRKLKSDSQHRRKRARERSKDERHVRKRKRSKRNYDVKPKKKSLKKSRKHTIVSSSSSDSQSCSACQSSDSERTTMEIERDRGRDVPRVHRKRKVRSPSCSSCSRDIDRSVSQTHEVVAMENSSGRLRSVIAAVEQANERDDKNQLEMVSNKEEIVSKHEDFPSPRSIESDDVGNKGESDCHSRDALNKKTRVGTVTVEVTNKDSLTGMEGSDKKNNAVEAKSDGVDFNVFEKQRTADFSVSVTDDVGGDDLEAILRQRALENLRKFRGEVKTNATTNLKTDNKSDDVNNISSVGPNIIQNKSTKQDSSYTESLAQETDHNMPTLKRDLSHHQDLKKDIAGHEDVEKEPRMSVVHPTDASKSVTMELTTVEQASGELTVKTQQNEAKDGSQFEKKRMTVMRGGEMVEVSYKVYIPKRAPAVARRPLRR